MLQIQFGDQGPRVVLLQILLNRRGNTSKVDGDFGPKTRCAVEQFQSGFGGLATGRVDPGTFNILFRGSVSLRRDLAPPVTEPRPSGSGCLQPCTPSRRPPALWRG